MGKEKRPRIPKENAAYVRDRLRRARRMKGMSLADAARAITQERHRAVQQRTAPDMPLSLIKTYPADVKRFEGQDPKRRPSPPLEYVAAAAKVYGVEEEWLRAEDDLSKEGYETEDWMTGDYIFQREETYERLADILTLAGELPSLPYQRDYWGDIHNALYQLSSLILRAVERRGLPFTRVLEIAGEVASVLPTPDRLPPEGFRSLHELSREEFNRFWTLLLFALEVLVRQAPPPSPMELERLEEEKHHKRLRTPSWEDLAAEWERYRQSGIPKQRAAEESWRARAKKLGELPMQNPTREYEEPLPVRRVSRDS